MAQYAHKGFFLKKIKHIAHKAFDEKISISKAVTADSEKLST